MAQVSGSSYKSIVLVDGINQRINEYLDVAKGIKGVGDGGALQISEDGQLTRVLGSFESDGAVQLDSTLAVTGAATLSSSLAVTGAATLSDTLAVTGAATLSSSLAVSGDATFAHDVTIGGQLKVEGGTVGTLITATQFVEAVQFDGNITLGSDENDSVTMNADLSFAANARINSAMNFEVDGASAGQYLISGIAVPAADYDAANKKYVDDQLDALAALSVGARGTIQLADGATPNKFTGEAALFWDIDNDALSVDGSAVFNEAGADKDFRIEGDAADHLFFVDGSADFIGINQAAPSARLDLVGGFKQASGAVSMSADAESSFSTSSGDLNISAAAELDLDGATVALDSSGAMALYSGSTLQIDAVGNSHLQTSGGDLDISAVAGDLSLAGATADLTTTGAMVVGSGSTLQIDAAGNSHLQTSSGDLDISAAVDLDLDGATVHMDASGQMDIAAGAALNVNATGKLSLISGDDLVLDPGASKHVTLALVASAAAHQIKNVKDPSDAQDAVTKSYMEKNGGGTASLAAGEAIALGDLVTLDKVTGKVLKADADTAGRHYAIGFATNAAAAEDDPVLIRMLGQMDLTHAVTPGAPVYMSVTAGAISATAPSNANEMVQRVGFALPSNKILVAIGEPVIL